MAEPLPFASRGLAAIERFAVWLREDSLEFAVYCGAAAILYVALVALRGLLRHLAGSPERHDPYSWREILARLLAKTRSFFLAATAAEIVTLGILAPPAIASAAGVIFMVLAFVQGAIWVREFVFAMIGRRAALSGGDQTTLASAMGVIRVLVTVAVFAIAVILILDNLGVNVTALVAGLGIGGIAIGLAAQGIFSDLFAALAILFDRPFQRGDPIAVDTLTGTVESIGLKTTRIRAISGEIVSVSNAKLLENRIHNLAHYNRRRVVVPFGIIYQTPPEVLAVLPAEIAAVVGSCDMATFERAHIVGFGASGIDFELVFYVESAALDDMIAVRHGVMVGIVRRFAALDVHFAYPTQMGFLAGVDGKAVDPLSAPGELRPAP